MLLWINVVSYCFYVRKITKVKRRRKDQTEVSKDAKSSKLTAQKRNRVSNKINVLFLGGVLQFNGALIYKVILRRCLLVAVVLWPMCCHKGISCGWQEMTFNPITVYRHRANLLLCYPLMWNLILGYTTTQLTWVRPDREILPWSSTHTSECSTLWCCYGWKEYELLKN